MWSGTPIRNGPHGVFAYVFKAILPIFQRRSSFPINRAMKTSRTRDILRRDRKRASTPAGGNAFRDGPKPVVSAGRWIAAGLVAALFLGACTTTPERGRDTASIVGALLKSAREHVEQNDHQAAAHDYLRLAELATGADRVDDLLLASGESLKGNFIEGAEHTLSLLEQETLTEAQARRKIVLDARLALATQRPDDALKLLSESQPETLSHQELAEIHELRALADERTGQTMEAVRERSARQDLLDASDADTLHDNEQILWQSLMALPPDMLEGETITPPPDHFSGWIALARIAKSQPSSLKDAEEGLAEWRRLYPDHPASPAVIDAVHTRLAQIYHRPKQIALLLPQTGKLAEWAAAFRDAFFMAYYDRGDKAYQPVIRSYDLGDDIASVGDVYDRAVADGAEFVIGPIRKEAVEALIANHRTFPVTTLVINYLDQGSETPAGLIQFGLAPEDEIKQIAQQAWLDGNNEALLLAPTGGWGDRLTGDFENEWSKLGGRVLELQRYDPEASDFSKPITALLDLDDSERRADLLNKRLGIRANFEPRRRHDADFVYLVANPRVGRLIRPQLKFHYASDLPVYAASSIFAGEDTDRFNRDLDGVSFCDIPWVLSGDRRTAAYHRTIDKLWPKDANRYTRIYALGVDAYHLIENIETLRTFPHERYFGETGVLSLQNGNRIFRQLQWARFVNGHAKPL
ncbi:MAG: hypothetical protein GC138_00425 [Gammaproteobacteria bacterium]|nr:hypothetical protein [Gammaproteobacteria bacterium]